MTRDTLLEGCATAAAFAVQAMIEIGLVFAAVAERALA